MCSVAPEAIIQSVFYVVDATKTFSELPKLSKDMQLVRESSSPNLEGSVLVVAIAARLGSASAVLAIFA